MTPSQSALISTLATAIIAAWIHIADRHYDAQADAVRSQASAESYRALITIAVRGCPE